MSAVAPPELQADWLSRAEFGASGTRLTRRPDDRGRLLWLHPVCLYRTSAASREVADELAPAFSERVALRDGFFAAGVGASAVVTSKGADEAAPIRLTMLHWAYYALYMEIDRGLLGVLNQPRWTEPKSLKQLEADADTVFADYLRVMNARTRLDSDLSGRGGDELAIWEAIAKVQRFDTLVKSVERKLDVLETLAERQVSRAADARTRRIGNVLGFLSFLTVVSVTGGLIGLLFGSQSPPTVPTWLRAATICGVALVVAYIYWLVFFRAGRRNEVRARRR